MVEEKSTAIYFCDQVNGNHNRININKITEFARTIPGIKVVWEHNKDFISSAEIIANKIKESGVGRIVLVGLLLDDLVELLD